MGVWRRPYKYPSKFAGRLLTVQTHNIYRTTIWLVKVGDLARAARLQEDVGQLLPVGLLGTFFDFDKLVSHQTVRFTVNGFRRFFGRRLD